MDILLFLLLFISFVCIYKGKKKLAIGAFFILMLLFVFWFSHHVTDSLNINL